MSDQDNGQVSTLQCPTNHDKEAWKEYWEAQGWPWRTEPEIAAERQKYLTERRLIVPDIKQGIYPFKDIKLSRADVEWLLATHENGRGPVDWSDESQRGRVGLDLRGANLNQINLRSLPLTCMWGGLTGSDWYYASPEECEMAAVHMERTILIQAHLEGAKLGMAHLNGINLFRAIVKNGELIRFVLVRANENTSFRLNLSTKYRYLVSSLLDRVLS